VRLFALVLSSICFLLGTSSLFAQTADTVRTGGSDTVIVFTARDSVHFDVSKKSMRLRGKADVVNRTQTLKAEVIEILFDESLLTARGVKDSTGITTGAPIFKDNGEEYAGESILFNLETRKGKVTMGETAIQGGFYYGSAIKRVSENTVYVENGCFTTCAAPHPHFYFSSPKMKAVLNDKVYLDPIVFYVEDIPVFAMPIGMYFSTQRGRQSGLVLPVPVLTNNRGLVLQKIGYYWAVSDYFDTEFLADITTKGGFVFYNNSRYSIKDNLDGHLELRAGLTRTDPDVPYTNDYLISWTHNQSLRPKEYFVASLNFQSTTIYQNTSLNVNDRLRQNARTNVSYQRTFWNGHTFNVGYNRDQNLSTNSVTQSPVASYAIPNFAPLRGLIDPTHWLSDLSLSFRVNGRYSASSTRATVSDTFATAENGGVELRPSLTVTPKLGFVTFQPTISYSENWYFQRYTQSVNPTDSTIATQREKGFFREYTYSVGVNASTFLYATGRPRLFGIEAFRHTLQPSVGLTFVPDQSGTSDGFYGRYVSPITNKEVLYSYYTNNALASIASSRRQLNLSMNLLNRFEIKGASTDSTPAKRLEILTFSAGGSYNMVADSLRMSDILLNVRTPVLDIVAFSSNFSFSIYDQALVANDATGKSEWRDIGQTLLSNGNGIARLKTMNFQLGTRFSSSGVSFGQRTTAVDTTKSDSSQSDLHSRFERRLNHVEQERDIYGDQTSGYSAVIMPWDMDVNLSYNYSRFNPDVTLQSLIISSNLNINLTQTLRVSGRASFDLLTGTVNTPVIDITKKLDCWNLSLNWVPTGANRGFFLRFSADGSILQDLQITKQNVPIYR